MCSVRLALLDDNDTGFCFHHAQLAIKRVLIIVRWCKAARDVQSPQGKFLKYTVGDLHEVDVHKISTVYVHYCRNGRGGLGRASGASFASPGLLKQ